MAPGLRETRSRLHGPPPNRPLRAAVLLVGALTAVPLAVLFSASMYGTVLALHLSPISMESQME